MKEYIERAPLLERLSKVKMDEHGFGLAVQFGIDHAINCIKDAPAAGVDLEQVLREKFAYNKTRSYRHGGKAL